MLGPLSSGSRVRPKMRMPARKSRQHRIKVVPEHLREDITKYFGFAVYWINRAWKSAIFQLGFDEVYAAALRGLFRASRGWHGDKGRFTTYSRHYIDAEILKLYLANKRFFRPTAKRPREDRRYHSVVLFSRLGLRYVNGSADVFAYTPEATLDLDAKLNISHWLRFLKPRWRAIIEAHYGLVDGVPMTLENTARKFSVTRERIRQIIIRAILNIKRNVTTAERKQLGVLADQE